MKASPRIVVDAPVAARADYLDRAYAGLRQSPDRLMERLDALVPWVGAKRVSQWHAMVSNRAFRALAQDLIEAHYDPAYRRARRRDKSCVDLELSLSDLSPSEIAATAQRIFSRLQAL